MALPTPERASYLVPVAEVYLLAILAGVALIVFDTRRIFRDRVVAIKSKGLAPISPGWMIPYVLSLKKYRRYFAASTIMYGFFYAAITSMIVYQPSVDFVGAYGATIPSLVITPLPGTPLFTPVVTAYLTNHLGLLLVPLTILLAIFISVLVGLNLALAGFAFDSRARGGGKGLASGIGAIIGLFTGCPTCAGLFFANFLGGTGAVSFATLLGYYQPAFILLSLPAMVAAPYLTSRSLSKVFREGCLVLEKTRSGSTSL